MMKRLKSYLLFIVFCALPGQVLACYYGSSQFYLGANTLAQPSYGNAYYGMNAGCRNYPGNGPFTGMTGYFYNPRGTVCGAGMGGAFGGHMYPVASAPMNMGGSFNHCFAMMALPSLTAGFSSYLNSRSTSSDVGYYSPSTMSPYYGSDDDGGYRRRDRYSLPSRSPYRINDDDPDEPTYVRTKPKPRRPSKDTSIDLTPADDDDPRPRPKPDDSCGRSDGDPSYGKPCEPVEKPEDSCGRTDLDPDYGKPCEPLEEPSEDNCGRPSGDPDYDKPCVKDQCGRSLDDPNYNGPCPKDSCGRDFEDPEYKDPCPMEDSCGRPFGDPDYLQPCLPAGDEKGDDKCGRPYGDPDYKKPCLPVGDEKGDDKCGRSYGDPDYKKPCLPAGDAKGDDKCGRAYGDPDYKKPCLPVGDEKGDDKCGRSYRDPDYKKPCPPAGDEKGDDQCGRSFRDPDYKKPCPPVGDEKGDDKCGRSFKDPDYKKPCPTKAPIRLLVPDDKDDCGRSKGDPNYNKPCGGDGRSKDKCGRSFDEPDYNRPCPNDVCGREFGDNGYKDPCPLKDECGREFGEPDYLKTCPGSKAEKPKDKCGRPHGDPNYDNPDCDYEEKLIIVPPVPVVEELPICKDPEDDGKGKEGKPKCIPLKEKCDELADDEKDTPLAKDCAELEKEQAQRAADLADEIPKIVDEALLKFTENCPEFRKSPNKVDFDHPGIGGAIRVMATLYQSCDVLNVEVYDRIKPGDIEKLSEAYLSVETSDTGRTRKLVDVEKYLNHHPYLKMVGHKEPGPLCRDLKAAPPGFVYNAKAKHKADEIDLFRDQSKIKSSYIEEGSHPITGLDCSGFIQAAMMADGLKLYPDGVSDRNGKTGEQLYQGGVSTWGLIDLARDRKSCLGVVELKNKGEAGFDLLQPGDILSSAGFHSLMIHSVGDDPFGIEKHKDDCENIVRQDFNFSVIQSGVGVQPGIGTAILSASGSYVSNDMIGDVEPQEGGVGNAELVFDNLVDMARQMCASKAGDKLKAQGRKIALIRHKSDKTDDNGDLMCKEPAKKLKDEQCVEQCLKEYGAKK